MRKFRSQQVIEKHKRIFWAKFIFFWVILLVVIFSISYISKKEEINIFHINIIGNEVTPDKDILAVVNKNLAGNYFKLFSKSNIFLYPKSQIQKELSNSFLIIKNIVISINDFQTIDINIEERKPFALYCEGGLKNQGGCYYLDNQAYIYAKAMNFSSNIYFKYYQENLSADRKILGQIYLNEAPERQFEKVNLFIRFLKDINLDVYKLNVKEDGDYELFFGNNSRLLFEEKQDFDILLENLQAFLIDLGDIGGKEFKYIDLRFDNKIFYKFKK